MRKLLLLLCAGLFVANAYAMEEINKKFEAATAAIDTLKSGVGTAVKALVEKIRAAADTKCETATKDATSATTKAQEEAKTQVEAAMDAIEEITKTLGTAQTEITTSINKMEEPETTEAT